MANSDNVVRGGLTSKPVDVGLFESIVDAAPSTPRSPDVSDIGGRRTYGVPAAEFALSRVDRDTLVVRPAPRIVLAVDGQVTIAAGDAALTLDAGQAAFVGYGDGAIEVTASALAFVVLPGTRRG
jgi:mannose-6-phosphate isomerase